MLKLIASQLLLVFYLVVTSGIQIKIHYCGGKISALSVFSHFGDPCSCGDEDESEENSDSCCKDEVKAAKFNEFGLLSSLPEIECSVIDIPFLTYNIVDVFRVSDNFINSFYASGASPPKVKKFILFHHLKVFSDF